MCEPVEKVFSHLSFIATIDQNVQENERGARMDNGAGGASSGCERGVDQALVRQWRDAVRPYGWRTQADTVARGDSVPSRKRPTTGKPGGVGDA